MAFTGEVITFYILAGLVLISGLLVVTLRNLFHCVLLLALSLTGIAVLFLLLNSEFLAAVQVLIYVGAITVLILFAVMLTHRISDRSIQQTNRQYLLSILIMVLLGTILSYSLWKTVWEVKPPLLSENGILNLGKLLLTTYLLPFEVVSILLLSALIGAITLARKENR